MLKNPSKFINIALIAFICSSGLSAGYVTDQLQEYTTGQNGDQFVRVLIIPVNDHNSAALKTSLAAQYSTRAERHRHGMEQLQAAADRSQGAIKGFLNKVESDGQAQNIKFLWVANLVEAEITVAALEQLADEPSVERIELYPTIVSIPAPKSDRPALSSAGVENNIKATGADSAWAAGYDGRGRIVCSFDTGVDGVHPALVNNYRGNKGYPASQCWFSSVDSSDYPHAFNSAGYSKPHGTHTTGIMVGHDDSNGDTIGVAPGADWIAAVAIDVPGASVFESFQWAIDPDGDPNTVSDVPDVINHSWGVPGIGCSELFWEIIDNSEALGIVNIFSAGNEGPDSLTIRNPANRAVDSLTNFAVGALNKTYDGLWFSSSKGPSDCDHVSIKPNVIAPGEFIRSSVPGVGYQYFNGTSGAAPHVSGAVAILRQKNPDATADEIKNALLLSCDDMGTPGPDNSYGWGRINIMEALRQIDAVAGPSLQVAGLTYPEIEPGDRLNLELALKNVGTSVDSVVATFSNPEDGLTIQTDQIEFGTIGQEETVTGPVTLDLRFSPTAVTGRFYSLDMNITGDGYSAYRRLSFFVGSRGVRTYFNHDTGRVKFTISNYGAFGFHTNSFISLGFEGYQLDRDTNDLYEGALLIGVDSLHVSDCAKNIAQEPDNDFTVSPGGSIVSMSPGVYADQETVSRFNDQWAEHPMGLEIEQRTYSWADDPDNTFIILEYIITNTSGVSVNGIRVGLFLDWDIRFFAQNHGSFLPGENIGYLCWTSNGDSADFRGVKVLSRKGLTNHRIYFNPSEVYYSNFTEARKYSGLATNAAGTMTTPADVSHVTATGPCNLGVNQSDTAVFAIIGGADWGAFMQSAVRAEQRYNDLPTGVDDNDIPGLPGAFMLRQNYPNPFNPSTTISLTTARTGNVRVDIFDILGRNVRTLINQPLSAGEHSFEWDGTDANGDPVASGVYFYRVRHNGGSQTRKMVMMK